MIAAARLASPRAPGEPVTALWRSASGRCRRRARPAGQAHGL